MQADQKFEKAVAGGNATGTVVALNEFIITVKGLRGASVGSFVLFESGQKGMVREIDQDQVIVLNIDTAIPALGSLVVMVERELSIPVGDGLIGRVVDPFGRPLDGKGPIQFTTSQPAFFPAPSITDRSTLNEQLPSGVSMVDTLFPVVLGQRIALLGDSKSGKTTFLLQMGAEQANTGRIVVYVLIGKRHVDVDNIISTLNTNGAMSHSVVVVANIFDSLVESYLAPYAGCAMAEYLWRNGRDVVIAYDDLASHAKVYREISLLAKSSPGRESYPGDMFYAHSSLLERAGKLKSNGKTLTALPVVVTPGDDITAYLPTSIMSITDGQIIFDLENFRKNVRPAVNTGLSVSRVGGRAQNTRQKKLTATMFKVLGSYKQASEFAHFASEMSDDSQRSLLLGRQLYDGLRQGPSDLYTLREQLLLFETILRGTGTKKLDITKLKSRLKDFAETMTEDNDAIMDQLLAEVAVGDA